MIQMSYCIECRKHSLILNCGGNSLCVYQDFGQVRGIKNLVKELAAICFWMNYVMHQMGRKNFVTQCSFQNAK